MEFAARAAESALVACAVASREGARLACAHGVTPDDIADTRLAALFAAACELPDLRGDLERTLRPMTLDAWREWMADELVPPAFDELGESVARAEACALACGAPVELVGALVATRPVMWDRSGSLAAVVLASSVARASAGLVEARVWGEVDAHRAAVLRLVEALEGGDRARLGSVAVVERREVVA